MRKAIRICVRLFTETFEALPPIVEIGAYFLPGYEALCDLRPYFAGQSYLGCDIRMGPGVDRIEDAQALSFEDASVGTLLVLDTLEHLPDPHRAVGEAHRVLRDDGLLLVSVPFNYRLHGFPTDYWRFTASGIHTLLAPFPEKLVLAVGPRVKPAFIFAVAAKTPTPRFDEGKTRFCERVSTTFGTWPARMRGHLSVLKERSRDLLGQLAGRAHLSVSVFDPSQGGGYAENRGREPEATEAAQPLRLPRVHRS